MKSKKSKAIKKQVSDLGLSEVLRSFQNLYGDSWKAAMKRYHNGSEWDPQFGPPLRRLRNLITGDPDLLPDLRSRKP